MYKLRERITRLLTEVKGLLVQDTLSVSEIEMRRGKLKFPCDLNSITDGFEVYKTGDVWSTEAFEDYVLFRFNINVPKLENNKECYLNITTNKSGGHNMVRPQALFYVGNDAIQGLDTNHELVRVTDYAESGEITAYVYAYSGSGKKTPYGSWVDMDTFDGVRMYVQMQMSDKELSDFYYNINTPFVFLNYFEEDSYEYQKILNTINEALSIVDFRIPHSKDFYESVNKANEYVEKTLYYKQNARGKATLVGHTHIDLAWLWRYEHTMDKAMRSFATEVELLNEYDSHRFMSSQAQLYDFVKKQDLELYEKIKELIKVGKWETEGAMWVEPDMNLVSGESIVLQILYGKKFFKDEFGVDCKVLWLPDVFGYTAALPQILKKAGVRYFMTSKLSANEKNRFPYDTFMWRGIDGSQILSHCTTYLSGGYNPCIEGGEVFSGCKNYKQKNINDDILVPFGFADGGGGCTREQIEFLKRMEKGIPGVPDVEIGVVSEYFDNLSQKVTGYKNLPVFSGEIYFENHRGTYTSMARMKKKNRQCEILYSNAQWLWSMANCFSHLPFPKQDIDYGIKNMLLNQFHDVLPGTAIKEVYDDADALYDEAFSIGEEIKNDALKVFEIEKNDNKMTVFNPFSEKVDGYVFHNGEYKFIQNVPAKGYATYSQEASLPQIPVTISGNVIENQYYIICINDNGEITSLYDKGAKRQCFIEGEMANCLHLYEDKSGIGIGDTVNNEDNWNLAVYYTEHEYEMPKAEKSYIYEKDAEHIVIRTERKYMNSTMIQDMIVYARSRRIDFKTELDWKEHSHVLRVEFPVDVNTNRATYEIQYGYIERPSVCNNSWDEAKFEVCGHRWADVSDGGYGMTLMNDCKYGYATKNSNISLTLLRCGNSPNPDADKEKHQFTYSILPHTGDIKCANVVKEGYMLNNPLIAMEGAVSDKFPETFSLFECHGAILDTIKPAEDDDSIVLRLYEPYNCGGKVVLSCGKNISKAVMTDLMENELKDVTINNEKNEISFDIKPFEIITLKVWIN